jgi:selenocysteine lyase/cysteine desulfurase
VLTRRQFLASGGAAAVATLAPGRLIAALERQKAAAPATPSDWPGIKAQFDLNPEHLQFSSFYLASHPRPVRRAIEDFRRALDADPYLVVEHGLFESEVDNVQLRLAETVAGYLGGRPDEIAFATNTTTGLALVYHGLQLSAADEVLTTEHDHYSHHESIRLAALRSGATWRKIPLFEQPEQCSVSEVLERIRRAMTDRTRVLGVTWVHSSSGVRLPIRDIAALLADLNARRDEADHVLLVVDGVHGLGAVDETVATMGCDFFCAGTHKWMFAPRGTGIVWAKADRWARLRPVVPSFSSLEAFEAWMNGTPLTSPNTASRVTPGGFQAYEHQWAMGEAFRFHEQIGRARVAGRIRALNDRCKAGLAKVPGLRLHTPRDAALSAGLVCFEIAGMNEGEVVRRLMERRIVASTSPYRTSYARLAPSLVNDEHEVDQVVQAVREVARS